MNCLKTLREFESLLRTGGSCVALAESKAIQRRGFLVACSISGFIAKKVPRSWMDSFCVDRGRRYRPVNSEHATSTTEMSSTF